MDLNLYNNSTLIYRRMALDLIIYTSCQFSTEHEYERESYIQDGLDFSEREKYHYEIALSAADGNNQQRITHNRELDHYPVWSPDGSRVAFIRFEGDSPRGNSM